MVVGWVLVTVIRFEGALLLNCFEFAAVMTVFDFGNGYSVCWVCLFLELWSRVGLLEFAFRLLC